MALSFRGHQVDMVSLAKKNEKVVALGNANMNGRGDILGKGGKIVKTREEVLADWYATHTVEKDVKNLKETIDNTTDEIVDEMVKKIRRNLCQSMKTSMMKKKKCLKGLRND